MLELPSFVTQPHPGKLMSGNDNRHFKTREVRAGVRPDPVTGAILTPIYQTTTYVQESVDQYLEKGYSYSRSGNPTVTALEDRITARGVRSRRSASESACETADGVYPSVSAAAAIVPRWATSRSMRSCCSVMSIASNHNEH